MSWEATAWAAKQEVGTTSGKLLLIVLSQYADQLGSLYWGQSKLMEACGFGEDTLRQRLNDLEHELGLIARFKQERDSGGYTVDMIVVLHNEAARDYADWLTENSELKERGRQTFRTINFSMAKSYERPARGRMVPRKNREVGNPSVPVSGTYPDSGREPKKENLNRISKSCADAPSIARDLGEPVGLASKEDEALRQACLDALVPGTQRVFVDYGTPPFEQWVKVYHRLGLPR